MDVLLLIPILSIIIIIIISWFATECESGGTVGGLCNEVMIFICSSVQVHSSRPNIHTVQKRGSLSPSPSRRRFLIVLSRYGGIY